MAICTTYPPPHLWASVSKSVKWERVLAYGLPIIGVWGIEALKSYCEGKGCLLGSGGVVCGLCTLGSHRQPQPPCALGVLHKWDFVLFHATPTPPPPATPAQAPQPFEPLIPHLGFGITIALPQGVAVKTRYSRHSGKCCQTGSEAFWMWSFTPYILFNFLDVIFLVPYLHAKDPGG